MNARNVHAHTVHRTLCYHSIVRRAEARRENISVAFFRFVKYSFGAVAAVVAVAADTHYRRHCNVMENPEESEFREFYNKLVRWIRIRFVIAVCLRAQEMRALAE